MDAAERRKQMIQESKFLGGDMEHTHLVKGLDYALLQKVRSEIEHQEFEDDEQLEEAIEGDKTEKVPEKKKDAEEEILFKTIIGKNIFRYLLYIFQGRKKSLIIPQVLKRCFQELKSHQSGTTNNSVPLFLMNLYIILTD